MNTVWVRTWTPIDHFLANLHFIGDGDFCLPFLSERTQNFVPGCSQPGSLMGGLLSIDQVLEKHRAASDFENDDRTELLLKH